MNRLFIIGAGASIDHSNGSMPGTRDFLVKAREVSTLDFYFDLDVEEFAISSDGEGGMEIDTREPLSEESETTQSYLAQFYGIWADSLGKKYWPHGFNAQEDKDYKNEQLLNRLKEINIEELLTLAIIARQIDQSLPSDDHIINLIVETINYYSGQVDPESGIYLNFAKQLDPQTDSIITFNWDTLLDQLFSKSYIPQFGVGPGIAEYYSNFLEVCTAEREASFDNAEIKPPYVPDSVLDSSEAAIFFGSHYIKLHGSVDLVNCTNNLCSNYQKPLIRKGEFPKENRCGVCHETVKLYIIPPIQNKPIRDMPFIRRSWNKAQELCKAADQVVFWGYSLPQTDYWSNWLVRQIWSGRCKEVVIINPECFSNGKEIDEGFVSRFCPKEKFGNKQMDRSIFKNFKDFLSSAKCGES